MHVTAASPQVWATPSKSCDGRERTPATVAARERDMRKELEQWRQARATRCTKPGKENTSHSKADVESIRSTPVKLAPAVAAPLAEIFPNSSRAHAPLLPARSPERRSPERALTDGRSPRVMDAPRRRSLGTRHGTIMSALAALEAGKEGPRAPPPSPSANFRDDPSRLLRWATAPEMLCPHLALQAAVAAAFSEIAATAAEEEVAEEEDKVEEASPQASSSSRDAVSSASPSSASASQMPVRRLLSRLDEAETGLAAGSPLKAKETLSPEQAAWATRSTSTKSSPASKSSSSKSSPNVDAASPAAGPKVLDISEELRLKLQRARMRADRDETEEGASPKAAEEEPGSPPEDSEDQRQLAEGHAEPEVDSPTRPCRGEDEEQLEVEKVEAKEEEKQGAAECSDKSPLPEQVEEDEEAAEKREDEELHRRHLELLNRLASLQNEAARAPLAAQEERPKIEEDIKGRFEAVTLELQELSRRQSSREAKAWRRRVQRHVATWPPQTALDMEDHLSRAHDIFSFWFFEMRDRVSNALPEFKPRTLERVTEYPSDWPQWKIDSARLREEASYSRRKSGAGLHQQCHDDLAVAGPEA
eukprot:gb/GFBE01025161.1/.p1 GENE.gb/GFBE01025161.1/~~gb/GFBE01025161.1/.p1  ORF type:complete len:591 (+),score=102.41 gb/GFBE01025161.1/:1-1773(+)